MSYKHNKLVEFGKKLASMSFCAHSGLVYVEVKFVSDADSKVHGVCTL